MKTIFAIIFLVFITKFTLAQYDSLSIFIENDTVKISNTKVGLPCGFNPFYVVNVEDSTINIIQRDTLDDLTTCTCMRDYSIYIVGLRSGNFNLIFFRSYPAEWKYEYNNPDTLITIGKLNFTINKSSPLIFSYSSYRSNCNPVENVDVQHEIPINYSLEAYPNPFNPSINILYSIPSTASVNLDIYDSLGRLVKNLYNGYKASGMYEIKFDGSRLSNGVYFCKMEINNNLIRTVKIILIK